MDESCELCGGTGLYLPPLPQDELWGMDPRCPKCGGDDTEKLDESEEAAE